MKAVTMTMDVRLQAKVSVRTVPLESALPFRLGVIPTGMLIV